MIFNNDFFQKITKKNSSISQLELELIISQLIKKSREWVIAHFDKIKLNKKQQEELEKKISQLKKGKPLAQILGKKEFFGSNFFINKNVLIPRPETEILVEEALKKIQKKLGEKTSKKFLIADIGTGSGAIIVSIVKNIPPKQRKHCLFFGTDISGSALQVARKNAREILKNHPIQFLKGNLTDPVEKKLKNFFSQANSRKNLSFEMFFLANLPYLSKKEFSSAPKNVRLFEPQKALLSPQNGFYHYKNLFQKLKNINKKYPHISLHLFIEFSPAQKRELLSLIKKIFPSLDKNKIIFYKDLAGKWRGMEVEISFASLATGGNK